MIFQILKIRKMVREGKEDPGKLAGGEVGDFIIGAAILPGIVTVGVLVLLFILSYTTLLGGPFGLAKFFFWVILFGTVILFYTLATIIRLARRLAKRAVDNTVKVTSKVIE